MRRDGCSCGISPQIHHNEADVVRSARPCGVDLAGFILVTHMKNSAETDLLKNNVICRLQSRLFIVPAKFMNRPGKTAFPKKSSMRIPIKSNFPGIIEVINGEKLIFVLEIIADQIFNNV